MNQNLNDINSTKNMGNLKRLTWNLVGKSGAVHKVVLNRGVNIRDPMSLVVDGTIIAHLQIPATSTLAKLEHSFTCDGETVTLILFAKKADIVVNGVFQGCKRRYNGYPKIGWWFLALMLLLNFTAPFVFQWRSISFIMAVCCSVLTWVMIVSPFQSKTRKVRSFFRKVGQNTSGGNQYVKVRTRAGNIQYTKGIGWIFHSEAALRSFICQ